MKKKPKPTFKRRKTITPNKRYAYNGNTLNDFEKEVLGWVNDRFSESEKYAFLTRRQAKAMFAGLYEVLGNRIEKAYREAKDPEETLTVWGFYGIGRFFVKLSKPPVFSVYKDGEYIPSLRFKMSNTMRKNLKDAGALTPRKK
tara:strand:- start:14 stop:442 length:429 start_codon:yes stop_codon:yes gene_type:complete